MLSQSNTLMDFLSEYPALAIIGNTPLVRLDLSMEIDQVEIYAKYEHLNPGGSV